MTDHKKHPSQADPPKDDLLYPKTAEQDAGSEPGIVGPSGDDELEGDDSAAEEARKTAYGDRPPGGSPSEGPSS